MDFYVVDMVIVGLILLLAIKGLVNGFSKELFNFLGLIGGIAIAARTHEMVGKIIVEEKILPEAIINYQKLLGFIAVFFATWIIFNIISSIVSKIASKEVGFISRFLGYLIGLARYLFIFSLILFGLNNADFLKEKFSKYYDKSQLFTPMVKIGEKLLYKEVNSTEERNTSKIVDVNISTTNIETTLKEDNVSY